MKNSASVYVWVWRDYFPNKNTIKKHLKNIYIYTHTPHAHMRSPRGNANVPWFEQNDHRKLNFTNTHTHKRCLDIATHFTWNLEEDYFQNYFCLVIDFAKKWGEMPFRNTCNCPNVVRLSGYTLPVPCFFFFHKFSKYLFSVLKTATEEVKISSKKITVYWKSWQSHLRMFYVIFSQPKSNFSLNVDTVYGFAVISEWKKRVKSETSMEYDIGSFELYIEIWMYLPLEVKGQFTCNQNGKKQHCVSNCQQYISQVLLLQYRFWVIWLVFYLKCCGWMQLLVQVIGSG